MDSNGAALPFRGEIVHLHNAATTDRTVKKAKVKFTLEQAMQAVTGKRGIALSFFNCGTRRRLRGGAVG
jgi:hypothetical protein